MRLIQIGSERYYTKQPHFALVDDEDYELLSQYKWDLYRENNTLYARTDSTDRRVQMHRLVTGLQGNHHYKKLITHKDGNGLNNQKENLIIKYQEPKPEEVIVTDKEEQKEDVMSLTVFFN